MEVHFNPEVQAKLSRMATQQGRDAATLVQEAVERLVDYDDWFLQEVDKGLAAADRANSSSMTPSGSSSIADTPANAGSLDADCR